MSRLPHPRTLSMLCLFTLAVGWGSTTLASRAQRGPLADVRAVGSFALRPCSVDTGSGGLQNALRKSVSNTRMDIDSNGVPVHNTGEFPNAGNPNTITPQDHFFSVRLEPEGTGGRLRRSRVGVAINGVPIDPATAEFWQGDRRSGLNYDALSGAIDLGLDCNRGHVQPTGAYHYHGIPEDLVTVDPAAPGMVHVGWAADGYPLYARYGHAEAIDPDSPVRALQPSYRLKEGSRSDGPGGSYDGTFVSDWEYVDGLGDLDACNGRVGHTPEHGMTYHYVLTDAFPMVPRCTVAEADDSFAMGPPPGLRGPPPRRR